MARVRAPLPKYLDDVDAKSLIRFDRDGTDAIFYNRGGKNLGTFPIGISNEAITVPALVNKTFWDGEKKQFLIKDWITLNNKNKKLTSPQIGSGSSVSFSPNGKYLAIGMNVYKIENETLNLIYTKAGYYATQGAKSRFSPNGKYLFIPIATAPYFAIINVSNLPYASELSLPSILPSGEIKSASWSADSKNLFLSLSGSLTRYMYRLTGTDTFTNYDLPSTIPGEFYSSSWSPDNKWLWISGIYNDSALWSYDIDGSFYPAPGIVPGQNVVSGYSAWHPSSKYLSVAPTPNTSSNVIITYKNDDGILTPIPDMSGIPSNSRSICWSSDGRYLFSQYYSAAEGGLLWNIYKLNGEKLSAVSHDNYVLGAQDPGGDIDVSPDGKYFATEVYQTDSYVTWFKTCNGPIAGIARDVTEVF